MKDKTAYTRVLRALGLLCREASEKGWYRTKYLLSDLLLAAIRFNSQNQLHPENGGYAGERRGDSREIDKRKMGESEKTTIPEALLKDIFAAAHETVRSSSCISGGLKGEDEKLHSLILSCPVLTRGILLNLAAREGRRAAIREAERLLQLSKKHEQWLSVHSCLLVQGELYCLERDGTRSKNMFMEALEVAILHSSAATAAATSRATAATGASSCATGGGDGSDGDEKDRMMMKYVGMQLEPSLALIGSALLSPTEEEEVLGRLRFPEKLLFLKDIMTLLKSPKFSSGEGWLRGPTMLRFLNMVEVIEQLPRTSNIDDREDEDERAGDGYGGVAAEDEERRVLSTRRISSKRGNAAMDSLAPHMMMTSSLRRPVLTNAPGAGGAPAASSSSSSISSHPPPPPIPSPFIASQSAFKASRSISDLPVPRSLLSREGKAEDGDSRRSTVKAPTPRKPQQSQHPWRHPVFSSPLQLTSSLASEVESFIRLTPLLSAIPSWAKFAKCVVVGCASLLFAAGDHYTASYLLRHLHEGDLLWDGDHTKLGWESELRGVELFLAVHFRLSRHRTTPFSLAEKPNDVNAAAYYLSSTETGCDDKEALHALHTFTQSLHATRCLPVIFLAAGIVCLAEMCVEHSCACFVRACEGLPCRFMPWLALGFAASAGKRRDAASQAYRAVAKAFPGCYHSLLYSAVDHILDDEEGCKRAERFITNVKTVEKRDPLIFAEQGIVAFHAKDFNRAELSFAAALERVCPIEEVMSDANFDTSSDRENVSQQQQHHHHHHQQHDDDGDEVLDAVQDVPFQAKSITRDDDGRENRKTTSSSSSSPSTLAWTRAMKNPSTVSALLSNFAFIAMCKRQHQRAVVTFLNAIRIDPSNYDARGGLGYAKLLAGQPEEGLFEFHKIYPLYATKDAFERVFSFALNAADAAGAPSVPLEPATRDELLFLTKHGLHGLGVSVSHMNRGVTPLSSGASSVQLTPSAGSVTAPRPASSTDMIL